MKVKDFIKTANTENKDIILYEFDKDGDIASSLFHTVEEIPSEYMDKEVIYATDDGTWNAVYIEI